MWIIGRVVAALDRRRHARLPKFDSVWDEAAYLNRLSPIERHRYYVDIADRHRDAPDGGFEQFIQLEECRRGQLRDPQL